MPSGKASGSGHCEESWTSTNEAGGIIGDGVGRLLVDLVELVQEQVKIATSIHLQARRKEVRKTTVGGEYRFVPSVHKTTKMQDEESSGRFLPHVG